jgi:hypothetical protein
MSASRIAASSALQVILRGKDKVRTVIVVIARLESHRFNRRLGRFILHLLLTTLSECTGTRRVPHVRTSVRGTKKTGRSPHHRISYVPVSRRKVLSYGTTGYPLAFHAASPPFKNLTRDLSIFGTSVSAF